jgi:hypothetical protein
VGRRMLLTRLFSQRVDQGGGRLAPQLGRPVGGAHARIHPCVNGSPLFWHWQLAPAPQSHHSPASASPRWWENYRSASPRRNTVYRLVTALFPRGSGVVTTSSLAHSTGMQS